LKGPLARLLLWLGEGAGALAFALGVRREAVARGLETFTAAFGRLERIQVEAQALITRLFAQAPIPSSETTGSARAPSAPRTT